VLLHMISRGGGGGNNNNNKNKNNNVYSRALHDQIVWLEQQLRLIQEEKEVLKKKGMRRRQKQCNQEDSASTVLPWSVNNRDRRRRRLRRQQQEDENEEHEHNADQQQTVDADADEELLRLAHLEHLEARKLSLVTVKSHLESLQCEFEQQLGALQREVSQSTACREALHRTLLARVTELERSLRNLLTIPPSSSSTTTTTTTATITTTTSDDNDNDNDNIDDDDEGDDFQLAQRIRKACEHAISKFWEEGYPKIENHEYQLKARHQQVLQEERNSAAVSVETQKQKMRALVKDTAIRERDLFATMAAAAVAAAKDQKQQQTATEMRQKKKKEQEEKEERQRREATQLVSSTRRRRKKKEVEKERRRDDAERKAAKEEEQRLRVKKLEHEVEIEVETTRVQRMKQLLLLEKKEEKKQWERRDQWERQRNMQQYAKEEQQEEQENHQSSITTTNKTINDGSSRSFFKKFLQREGPRSKTTPTTPTTITPTHASIENFQRRVLWQPITLPPKDVVRITTINTTSQ